MQTDEFKQMEIKRFYGRVSTEKQSILRQTDLAQRLEIPEERVYWEKMTGTKSKRPEFERMIEDIKNEKLVRGDKVVQTVHIESLSRLGRSTKDLLSLLEKFEKLNVTVISSKEQIDTSSSTGRLMTTILCALAEFERDLTVERTKSGLEASRARGKVGGRPKTDKGTIKIALSLYDSKEYSVKEICIRCGISQGTLYNALKVRNT
jgi:DNA invertase Pin-like site-specific DNA recombinase